MPVSFCVDCGARISLGSYRCRACQIIFTQSAPPVFKFRIELRVNALQNFFLHTKPNMNEFLRAFVDSEIKKEFADLLKSRKS